MDGYPVLDMSGFQVATKRVTILWRYVDANCDGVMTWGMGPADGSDYLRIVPRTLYNFTSQMAAMTNTNHEVQITTHHFGPLDPITGAFRQTAFREVHHDDLIPGLPAPGDLSVTQGIDGPPIPGITARINLFTASGDVVFVPGFIGTWGAKFTLRSIRSYPMEPSPRAPTCSSILS
ncbi:MAG: hypothetical protein ACE5GK_12140 [Nitrospiria bacterium]